MMFEQTLVQVCPVVATQYWKRMKWYWLRKTISIGWMEDPIKSRVSKKMLQFTIKNFLVKVLIISPRLYVCILRAELVKARCRSKNGDQVVLYCRKFQWTAGRNNTTIIRKSLFSLLRLVRAIHFLRPPIKRASNTLSIFRSLPQHVCLISRQ
jgi:hypothetical protein